MKITQILWAVTAALGAVFAAVFLFLTCWLPLASAETYMVASLSGLVALLGGAILFTYRGHQGRPVFFSLLLLAAIALQALLLVHATAKIQPRPTPAPPPTTMEERVRDYGLAHFDTLDADGSGVVSESELRQKAADPALPAGDKEVLDYAADNVAAIGSLIPAKPGVEKAEPVHGVSREDFQSYPSRAQKR